MEQENINQIADKSAAFNKGKEDALVWVEQFKSKGQPVMLPKFPTASTILEQYYQRGYLETVQKHTQFTNHNYKPFNKSANRKQRPNSIDKMIKEKGENFLVNLGSKGEFELKNFANRVLEDMVRSNLDATEYEIQLENPKLLDFLIGEASNQYRYHETMKYSLLVVQNNVMNGNITDFVFDDVTLGFLNYHSTRSNIYELLYNKLTDFKNYLSNGVFRPDILNTAQNTIYKERWANIARDPYTRTRLF